MSSIDYLVLSIFSTECQTSI